MRQPYLSSHVPLSSNFLQLFLGDPEAFPRQSLQDPLGLSQGLLPVAHAQKTFKREASRRPHLTLQQTAYPSPTPCFTSLVNKTLRYLRRFSTDNHGLRFGGPDSYTPNMHTVQQRNNLQSLAEQDPITKAAHGDCGPDGPVQSSEQSAVHDGRTQITKLCFSKR